MFMATGICSAPARRWKRSRFEESGPDSSNSHPESARMMRNRREIPRYRSEWQRKAVNPRLRFRCELGSDDACGDQSQSGASCFFSRGS